MDDFSGMESTGTIAESCLVDETPEVLCTEPSTPPLTSPDINEPEPQFCFPSLQLPEPVLPNQSTENENSCTLERSEPQEPEQHPLIPMLQAEVDALRDERDELREEKEQLLRQVDLVRLSSSAITDNDTRSQFFTGLPWDIFIKTFFFICNFIPPQYLHKDGLPLQEQFFITLVKLRLGLPLELLAYQTGVGESTVHRYFWKWMDIIYSKLGYLLKWPDRGSVFSSLPGNFKSKFPRLTCLIDCFEIFIDQPRHLLGRAVTWSNYKKHNTVKFLIGCTPLGSVSFMSKAWGGRVSDVELVRQSGFIDPHLHMPGDQILADRGFTLQDDFATICSTELIIPAFTKGKRQLSAMEVETSRSMAAVRIHVERVIGLMKRRFRILHGTLPITLIKSLSDEAAECDTASIDKIVHVCAILTNLGESVVRKPTSD